MDLVTLITQYLALEPTGYTFANLSSMTATERGLFILKPDGSIVIRLTSYDEPFGKVTSESETVLPLDFFSSPDNDPVGYEGITALTSARLGEELAGRFAQLKRTKSPSKTLMTLSGSIVLPQSVLDETPALGALVATLAV